MITTTYCVTSKRLSPPYLHLVWREWLPAVLVASATLLVAATGWQMNRLLVLRVGHSHTSMFLPSGFYEREQVVIGQARWTMPSATVWLPGMPHPAIVTMRMTGRPGGSEVRIVADERRVARIQVADNQLRRYQFLNPMSPPGSGRTHIALQDMTLSALNVPDDPRELTVMIKRIKLQSTGGIPLLPLLPPLAWLPTLCSIMIGWGLRSSGATRIWAWSLALAVGVALAAGWGWARIWFDPFLPATTAGMALIVALLVILHRTTGRGARACQLLAVLAVAAGPLTLYMLIARLWPLLLHHENIPLLLIPLGLVLLLFKEQRFPAVIMTSLILLVAGSFGLGMFWDIFRSSYSHDFNAIHTGVAGYITYGQPLYNLAGISGNPFDAHYKYPPSFAFTFYPFALLNSTLALYIWRLLNTALLLVSAGVLLRAYHVRLCSWPAAGLALVLLLMQPIRDALRYGQIDIIVLCALSCGLLAVRRERWGWMGVALGLAATLKLYPVYILGLSCAQRRWWALGGAVLAAICIGVASLVVLGGQPWFVFLSEVLQATGGGTAWVENQTFNGFINRLFIADSIGLEPDGGGWVTLATYAWFVVLTTVTFWFTQAGRLRPDLGYGLWTVTLVLVLPVAWMHYLAILVVPIFQLLVLADEDEEGLAWPSVACLFLAFMLIAPGNPWTFFNRTLHGPYWQLILSYKFYGMLLLYAALVLSNRRSTVKSLNPLVGEDAEEVVDYEMPPGEQIAPQRLRQSAFPDGDVGL